MSNYDAKLLQGTIPYWNELYQHGSFDSYWKDRALETKMQNIHCAVLTVGGWFDAEDMWGALNLYQNTERQNKGIFNALVMGPWSHGQWAGRNGQSLGPWQFGQDTSDYYRENIEFPFFERYLNNKTDAAPTAEATLFETGSNKWRTFAKWPVETTPFYAYLDGNRSVSFTKPTASGAGDTYTYDPAAPTPYIAEWETSKRRPTTYMVADQTWASTRPDVLTYTSAPLTEDTTFAGAVGVEFWAATTGTDADFVVKVCDMYPEGTDATSPTGDSLANKMLLLRGDILRGKFRDSFEKPAPFVPNQPTKVNFTMNDVLHTFKKGHRIVIQVQSAWFPLVDRNPNVFTDIYKAKDADFKPANITILHTPKYPSRVKFGLLKP